MKNLITKANYFLPLRYAAVLLLLPLSCLAQVLDLDLVAHPESYNQNMTTLKANMNPNNIVPTDIRIGAARPGAGPSSYVWRVVGYLGEGAGSTVFKVQIGTRFFALKVPKDLKYVSSEPKIRSNLLKDFEKTGNQLQDLYEWFAKRADHLTQRITKILNLQPRRFILTELVDGPTFREFLKNYDPADPVQAARMDDLIATGKELKDYTNIEDVHAGNGGFKDINAKIFDGANPRSNFEPVTLATHSDGLTALEAIGGVYEEGYSAAQLKVKFVESEICNPAAAARLAEGTMEIRALRTNLPPLEFPAAGEACSIRPSGSGSGMTLAFGLLEFISIAESVHDELTTAQGAPAGSKWDGKPGVICDQLKPREHTLYCERDRGIFDVFFGGQFNCTYIASVDENGFEKYLKNSSVKTCSVEYRSFALKLKTDSDYDFAKVMAKNALGSYITTDALAESYLESNFSYRFNHDGDVSSHLIYPPGGQVF